MPSVRIAVASTPLTNSIADAVPPVLAAIAAAAAQDAPIVCLPETCVPGHRSQPRPVEACTQDALDAAIAQIAATAAAHHVAVILGTERVTDHGRVITAVVIDTDGNVLGEQPKTQLDPSEDPLYVPGSGRRLFTAAGVTFGVATCHEAYRYPELARMTARSGGQVLFVPHYVTTEGGPLPTQWCAPSNPYNEKALMCRAIENTIFVAAADIAGPDQGSATCIIDPSGALIAQVPYGQVGVAVADVDLSAATGLIAHRWAPERNRLDV